MTEPHPEAPILVCLLTADQPSTLLTRLGELDDRLGIVSLPPDAPPDRLASVDPDCVIVDDVDSTSVVDAYDSAVPVFHYRSDDSGGSTTQAGVTGVLTRDAVTDALDTAKTDAASDTATDGGRIDGRATTRQPDTTASPESPAGRIVEAVSTYWLPDDATLRDVALDAVSVGVSISDPSKPDNPLIYVNEQFTQITGYSEHEVLGRNCRFLQGPDTDPEPVAELRRAVEDGRPTFVELQNYRRDGTPFWNELQIIPLTDEGEVTYFLGLQRDVSEAHRRTETNDRLADARREVREIAHDDADSPVARIEALLALGRETLQVSNAHLVFVDRARDYHEVVRTDGSALVERGDTIPLSESYCRHSIDDSTAYAFHDPDEADLDDDPAHARHRMGCYFSEPVYRDDDLYGTLCFADETPRSPEFAEVERQLITLLSTHVGRLLSQAQADGVAPRTE